MKEEEHGRRHKSKNQELKTGDEEEQGGAGNTLKKKSKRKARTRGVNEKQKQGRVTLVSHNLRVRQHLNQVNLFFSSAI